MAISVVAHVVLLTAAALHAPKLLAPPMQSGPPEPIIPVLIMPKVPPPHAGGPTQPIRLHRRQLRNMPPHPEVPPLIVPQAEPEPASQPRQAPARPSAPDPVAANARQALRGLVGCANPALLSREEREKCDERLARGGRDAPFPGLGLDRRDSSEFGGAAAQREAAYRYKRGEESRPRAPGSQVDWDVQRSPPAGAAHMKGMGGSPADASAAAGRPRE